MTPISQFIVFCRSFADASRLKVTVMVNAVAEVPLEGEMVVLARPPLVWPDVGYI